MQLKNDANIETFTMKNITKIYKYKRKKKLNSTSSTENRTEMNTSKSKYQKN